MARPSNLVWRDGLLIIRSPRRTSWDVLMRRFDLHRSFYRSADITGLRCGDVVRPFERTIVDECCSLKVLFGDGDRREFGEEGERERGQSVLKSMGLMSIWFRSRGRARGKGGKRVQVDDESLH